MLHTYVAPTTERAHAVAGPWLRRYLATAIDLEASAVTAGGRMSGDKPGRDFLSVTVILDGDSALEIVAVTLSGVFVVDTDSTTTLRPPGLIDGLPGGTLIAAGDLTGDGVEDLVVGGFGSTYIFRGVPVLR